MKFFDYVRPATVNEALATWEPGSAYLGGGTNLVDLMKTGALAPGKVIDISRLPGLKAVETMPDGSTRIGALVRNSDLAHNPEFSAEFPMVAEALLSGASGQLRNAATMGGNLMQRTRCPYFQDLHSACNRRSPGSGCDAREGVNGTMAVLGWNPACIATNPSDLAVPLVALDATIEVAGPAGVRTIKISEFHQLPGETPEMETLLEPGELILAIHLPPGASAFARNARYLKLRDRTSFAFALVSAAAALRIEDGAIAEARLALGAVAARPWRVREAELLLEGEAPGEDVFVRAAARLMEGAAPSGDNAPKIELARRTAVRALRLAALGTPSRPAALPASLFEETVHA